MTRRLLSTLLTAAGLSIALFGPRLARAFDLGGLLILAAGAYLAGIGVGMGCPGGRG